jgi:hypothetical protein
MTHPAHCPILYVERFSFALRFLTDQVPFDVTVSNQGLEEQQHTQEQPNSYRALEP